MRLCLYQQGHTIYNRSLREFNYRKDEALERHLQHVNGAVVSHAWWLKSTEGDATE